MTRKKFSTREEWLNSALTLLKPVLSPIELPVPSKIRVSCGFPSRNAFGKKRRIGECWGDSASKGNYFEIFIHPELDEPVRVLDVLTHEMVHAVVGIKAQHGPVFARAASVVGLMGKPTATVAGPELEARLKRIVRELGAYPHDKLDGMISAERKPDRCRLLKAECPDCGYVIRTTRKWMEEAGLPICPCGGQFAE